MYEEGGYKVGRGGAGGAGGSQRANPSVDLALSLPSGRVRILERHVASVCAASKSKPIRGRPPCSYSLQEVTQEVLSIFMQNTGFHKEKCFPKKFRLRRAGITRVCRSLSVFVARLRAAGGDPPPVRVFRKAENTGWGRQKGEHHW